MENFLSNPSNKVETKARQANRFLERLNNFFKYSICDRGTPVVNLWIDNNTVYICLAPESTEEITADRPLTVTALIICGDHVEIHMKDVLDHSQASFDASTQETFMGSDPLNLKNPEEASNTVKFAIQTELVFAWGLDDSHWALEAPLYRLGI